MDAIRMIARPAMGALGIAMGLNHIKNPSYGAEVAEQLNDAGLTPEGVPTDGETLMKAHGYVLAAAGGALALGIMPRTAALVLAGDIALTTALAHRFWEKDGMEAQNDQIAFYKNVALVGGYLIASADTAGKPGLAWRASHLTDSLADSASHAGEIAGLKKEIASLRAQKAIADRKHDAAMRATRLGHRASSTTPSVDDLKAGLAKLGIQI